MNTLKKLSAGLAAVSVIYMAIAALRILTTPSGSKVEENICQANSKYVSTGDGSYDIVYKSRGEMNAPQFSAANQKASSVALEVRGLLVRQGAFLNFEHTSASIKVNSTTMSPAVFLDNLNKGFTIVQSASGVGISVPEHTDDMTIGFYRELITQVSLPEKIKSCSRVDGEIEDLNGRLNATWTKEVNRTGFTVDLSRGEYTALHSNSKDTKFQSSGGGKVQFDGRYTLISLTTDVEVEVLTKGKKVGHTHNTFFIRSKGDANAPSFSTSVRKSESKKYVDVGQSARDIIARAQIQSYKNTLDKTTLEDLAGALNSVDAGIQELTGGRAATIVNQLHAYVMLQDSLAEIESRILSSKPDSLQFKYLVGSLAHAGTSASQDLLMSLADRYTQNPIGLTTIVASASQVQNPNESFVNSVMNIAGKGVSNHIANTVVLVVGTLAGNSQGTATYARYEEIMHKKMLEQGSIPNPLYLASLGNMKSARLLPLLDDVQNYSDDFVRASVVNSVRDLNDSKVNSSLALLLNTDKSESVKAAVARAAANRPYDAEVSQGMLKLLTSEKSVSLKINLLESLWKFHGKDANILAQFHLTAEKDPSSEVRSVAERCLASI